MIKTDNLTKRFGSTIALDDVSFEVKKGETFGLLGPNGAGKTTTIQLICGLQSATFWSIANYHPLTSP
jgi:ABC-2 type transport system ATP-binding protein